MSKNYLDGAYVVFSDLQGSFDDLARLLKATKKMLKEGYICLGDIVKNYEDFSDNRCLEAVRDNVKYCVRGNHEDKSRLSEEIKGKITPDCLAYVRGLQRVLDLGNVLLFHSSVRSEGLRLRNEEQIEEEIKCIHERYPKVRFALFGHTHQAGVYSLDGSKFNHLERTEFQLDPEKLNLINPGGIGLRDNLEKTFARVDFGTGQFNLFILNEAEELAHATDIINAFDSRWMPVLNPQSYPWFLAYAKNDAPSLKERGQKEPLYQELAQQLLSFDAEHCEKVGRDRVREYIKEYSLDLAGSLDKIRQKVKGLYETVGPFESRTDYLNLKK